MQFVSTVSSFLHIMIRHNVDFCKNEPRFMPLIIFHLNCILLLMMKMNKKQFLFHSWKIRAEGRSPLRCFGCGVLCIVVDIGVVKIDTPADRSIPKLLLFVFSQLLGHYHNIPYCNSIKNIWYSELSICINLKSTKCF